MSCNVWKRTFWYVHPTKTQISLRIRTAWSVLWSYFAFLPSYPKNAPSEDSDQTARMRSLIWMFAGRTCPKVRIFFDASAHNICELS